MYALLVEDGGTVPSGEVLNVHVLTVEDDAIYSAFGEVCLRRRQGTCVFYW